MIDWDRVNTLREEVGKEDFDEIVALFLEEVDASIVRLKEQPDPDSLGADLHFVKGSAAGLGFAAFVTQCQIGETQCAQGEVDQVDLTGILDCYQASKRHFLEKMPQVLMN